MRWAIKKLFAKQWHETATVFVPKNGLSLLVMLAIQKSGAAHENIRFFLGDNTRHRRDIAYCSRIFENEQLLESDASPPRKGRMFVTTSVDETAKDFVSRGRHLEKIIVEHGTAECWRFIEASKGRQSWPGNKFVTLFHHRLEKYLESRSLVAPVAFEQVPMKDLKELVEELSPKSTTRSDDISLFVVQPLVDRGSLPAETLELIIDQFLERQPPKHYRIKDHPHRSPLTIEVLERGLMRHGLSFDVIPPNEPFIEVSFPKYGCGEISTFYSTGAITCAELHTVPSFTMIKEIAPYHNQMSPGQKQMFPFINDFFGDA